jgi:hypothetical protein
MSQKVRPPFPVSQGIFFKSRSYFPFSKELHAILEMDQQ